jgi:hypothetical protein
MQLNKGCVNLKNFFYNQGLSRDSAHKNVLNNFKTLFKMALHLKRNF